MTRHDGEEFERLLAHGVAELGVEVHAYCLMLNHFHLLVHCPDGGLSVFMQRLMSRYTRYANARLGRDGALFRGRFRSKPIGSPEQIINTSVYIHRNPDDTARAGELHEYRWSSLRWYVDRGSPPSWLSRDVVLGYFGDEPERYLAYVANGV